MKKLLVIDDAQTAKGSAINALPFAYIADI